MSITISKYAQETVFIVHKLFIYIVYIIYALSKLFPALILKLLYS